MKCVPIFLTSRVLSAGGIAIYLQEEHQRSGSVDESLKIAQILPELRRRICVNVATMEITFQKK